ncbi:hypothetical protein Tco_0285435 [Tanacetum coccineum]
MTSVSTQSHTLYPTIRCALLRSDGESSGVAEAEYENSDTKLCMIEPNLLVLRYLVKEEKPMTLDPEADIGGVRGTGNDYCVGGEENRRVFVLGGEGGDRGTRTEGGVVLRKGTSIVCDLGNSGGLIYCISKFVESKTSVAHMCACISGSEIGAERSN